MPSSGVQTCALRSEEHTSELQSHDNLVCRLLFEKNNFMTLRYKKAVFGLIFLRCVLFFTSSTSNYRKLFVSFFLMIRRPPRSTLFPYRRSSDLEHTSELQSHDNLVCRLLEFRRVL